MGASAIGNWFFGGSSSSRAVDLLGLVLQTASEQAEKRMTASNRAWYSLRWFVLCVYHVNEACFKPPRILGSPLSAFLSGLDRNILKCTYYSH